MDTLEYILNKFNITKVPRHTAPIEIPNFGRIQLADLFRELEFKVGAEIGVEKGYYSATLCKANPDLHLFSIDPWRVTAYGLSATEYKDTQATFERYYQAAKKRLAPYQCEVLRWTSMYAVDEFDADSLDFVYIDGNHDFQNTVNDIVEWSKKVRPGGIISGHDYCYYRKEANIHVKYVVNAYTQAYGIIPWFVLGAQASHVPGVVRDQPRSWMWVKK